MKKPGLIAGLLLALVVMMLTPDNARAETRLYHLRVTLRSGERYETISASDPISYCHTHGGSVVWLRDYSLIYSAEMRVLVLRTWMEPGGGLAARWQNILRANGMLANNNHKKLPRVRPLSLADMIRPE
ncbi:MAG: hypothetical protein C4532_19575 [Candidatus Abyssobacteria bacterium SURF_17]|uniref:Uncharacterized protein n=1 Tax=Candidatus Abyssobacteria bacterium SURF_17 TaxID=2093361 RepID=A0A419ENI2_9BACT|nr:MAG: hypothetical protein C4532_19575 [Candidatus Abyssubacteria bacterium SURF_17]